MTLLHLTAALHVLTGIGYLFAVGLLTGIDLIRMGPSAPKAIRMYGWGLIALALTCGPHHLEHGLHLFTGHTPYRALDLVTVAAGIPPAAVWTFLRTRALFGKAGDAYGHMPCEYVALIDLGSGLYLGAIATLMVLWFRGASWSYGSMPQLALVVLYWLIAWWMWQTQRQRVCKQGTLSLSGLALSLIFLTCGLSHSVYAYRLIDGSFHNDWHMLTIDTLGVVAAVWFCMQFRRLRHMGSTAVLGS